MSFQSDMRIYGRRVRRLRDKLKLLCTPQAPQKDLSKKVVRRAIIRSKTISAGGKQHSDDLAQDTRRVSTPLLVYGQNCRISKVYAEIGGGHNPAKDYPVSALSDTSHSEEDSTASTVSAYRLRGSF
jgi:hypothetical protein